MKHIFNKLSRTKLVLVIVAAASMVVSCVGDEIFRDELPAANSKVDEIFPEANFSYASSADDFRIINFTNLSSEASTYLWDFGDGNTTDEEDPSFTFEGEGTYAVSLTATDGNGETGTTSIDVIVVEGPFQPIILEAGFEDDTLPEGGGDGRDSWRNSDLGGVIQITGSPVTFGDQGAKLPTPAGDRVGYQEITVDPDTNYDLSFWYTMLSGSSDARLIVSVLGVTENGGTFTSLDDVANRTIATVTVTDDSEPDVYLQQKLSFNSGSNNTVAIFFTNGEVEGRLDDFTIEVGAEGAVPPSVGFEAQQSEIDYLEYTFANASAGATSYEWDFGDGNISTEESPTHVYAEPDTYTITLVVSNDAGLSNTLEQSITILAPVTADFTSQVDPNDYQTFTFTDASEGLIESLLWEFGDGFQFTGMNPSHTYAEDGIYTVTLTATSITGNTDVATEELVVSQGFVVQVLNGTFDEYTFNTGDNADAWDMTPNSTLVDNDGNTIDSPYRPLWFNEPLQDWLEIEYSDNSEQPGSTADGNNDTRGGKLEEPSRRLYQVVQVQQGVSYTFSIDSRTSGYQTNSDVFILNTEIADETGINASTSDSAVDAYFEITNDFNADSDVFVTSSFSFTPSTNQIVIYVRNVDVVDNTAEAFYDNIEITD